MIGDTEYDLQMAHTIQMHAAGVSYGVHGRERLVALNPRVCLEDIRELPGYRIERVQLFDMFPHTAHYEVLTLLSRQ